MNSQKIISNYLENKIRQFKAGVDYRLTEEKYHMPEENGPGHTNRTYQIYSPQLNQLIQNYLQQQNAIFMSFDFEGLEFTNERIRPDNSGTDRTEKYHAVVSDENGDALNYGFYGEGAETGFSLGITYWDRGDGRKKAEFNQQYQRAKQAWEAKGSPLHHTPPTGVKCWYCYQVISEADIAAGRYRLDNNRIGTTESGRLVFYKTFEHVKEVCHPLEYDCALRNNYRYDSNLEKQWLEYPQKSHEYNCQDCLNRFWNEVNGNLIYLETWAKEQKGLIDRHQQVLVEIEARLAQLRENGQFHNCGIKKCCAKHDRPDYSQSKNRDLIRAASGPQKELPEPEKSTLDRQTILNWMKEQKIVEISLNPANSAQLIIKYENGKTSHLEISNDLPEQWGRFLKQEVAKAPISLNQPVNHPSPNNWPTGLIVAGSLMIIGLVSVIAILVHQRKKKT